MFNIYIYVYIILNLKLKTTAKHLQPMVVLQKPTKKSAENPQETRIPWFGFMTMNLPPGSWRMVVRKNQGEKLPFVWCQFGGFRGHVLTNDMLVVFYLSYKKSAYMTGYDSVQPYNTVDGRNPEQPPGMYKTLQTMGQTTYQLVQNFVHQQYYNHTTPVVPF